MFRGAFDNFLNGGSLEITFTVPVSRKHFLMSYKTRQDSKETQVMIINSQLNMKHRKYFNRIKNYRVTHKECDYNDELKFFKSLKIELDILNDFEVKETSLQL